MKPKDKMLQIADGMLLSEFSNVAKESQYRDVYGFNPGGESCEIEIKVACYDLYKEFSKDSKVRKHARYMIAHKEKRTKEVPTRFYFFVLGDSLARRALALVDKHNLPYGVIKYKPGKDKTYIMRKSQKLGY